MAIDSTINQLTNTADAKQYNDHTILFESFSFLNNNIALTSIPHDISIAKDEYILSIMQLNDWTRQVAQLLVTNNQAPAQSTNNMRKENNIYTANIVINGNQLKLKYDAIAKEFIVEKRHAFTLTWGGFLFFLNAHNSFLNYVQSF